MARLHTRKGAHILVDAIHHLPEAWLAIVGPDEGQGAALRERAKDRGDADRVVFTGLLTGQDKLAALAGADVLALPAVGEGLPIVALEALAAGLPVALSDGCHLPEVFAAGAGVRLERLQGKIVARALAPVLTDPALRQAMGERGKSLVAGYFTWEAAASQMVNIYGNFHTQH